MVAAECFEAHEATKSRFDPLKWVLDTTGLVAWMMIPRGAQR